MEDLLASCATTILGYDRMHKLAFYISNVFITVGWNNLKTRSLVKFRKLLFFYIVYNIFLPLGVSKKTRRYLRFYTQNLAKLQALEKLQNLFFLMLLVCYIWHRDPLKIMISKWILLLAGVKLSVKLRCYIL